MTRPSVSSLARAIAATILVVSIPHPGSADAAQTSPRSPTMTSPGVPDRIDPITFPDASDVIRLVQVIHEQVRPVVHLRRPTTTRARRTSAATEACIARQENHGDYGRSTNPTHFGKYQYDRPTWEAHGGNPDDWGTASPEEQERVFRNGVNQYGYSAWTRYDGC